MLKKFAFPRTSPEAQGIPSSAIQSFLADVEKNIHDLHSFMLLRNGVVVAEGWWSPYGPQYPHMLFSLSKSFTSTAVGLAVAEGYLTVEDPVLSFFPEDAPPKPSQKLAAMRVRHLLTMTTGHAEDTTGFLFRRRDGNWVKAFLSRPVKHEPGTFFLYNSGASYMLSAIVQKLTGQTVLEYLRPRLFEPLGIENPTWESCPRGVNVGGWGLSIKTEDIARFGQLYLQKGMWNGERLLPETWVEEATSRQVSNGSKEDSDWEQGYGYQFWRCRHEVYRGDGAFGQYCIVMPRQNAVLAITSAVGDMQSVLNLVWKHLLPAMGDAPLGEDLATQKDLDAQLASLAIPLPVGERSSPWAEKVSGKRYLFEKNQAKVKWASFDFTDGKCTFTLKDARGKHLIRCEHGAWRYDKTTLESKEPTPVAAAGAWSAENVYTLKLCYYETPFCPVITCRFEDDRVTIEHTQNVSFVPQERPPLVGRYQ